MNEELKKELQSLRKDLRETLDKAKNKQINLLRANTINYTASNILRSIDLEIKLNKSENIN